MQIWMAMSQPLTINITLIKKDTLTKSFTDIYRNVHRIYNGIFFNIFVLLSLNIALYYT